MQGILPNTLQVVVQGVPRFIDAFGGQGMTRFTTRKPVFQCIGLDARTGCRSRMVVTWQFGQVVLMVGIFDALQIRRCVVVFCKTSPV